MYDDYIFAVSNRPRCAGEGIARQGCGPEHRLAERRSRARHRSACGYTGTVDALLAAKANVNARSKFGDSAIMAARCPAISISSRSCARAARRSTAAAGRR
jgi:hypothetical protein